MIQCDVNWTEPKEQRDDLDRSDIVCDSDTVVISIESHLSTQSASAKATKKRKKERKVQNILRRALSVLSREEIFVWFHVILLFFPSVISPLILSQSQQLRRYSVFSNNKDDDDAMRTKRRRQAAKRRILSRPKWTKPVAQNFSFFFFCILCMIFRHYRVWSILALCATLYWREFCTYMQQCTAKWVAFRKLFEFHHDASTRIRLGFSFSFCSPLPRTSHRGVIDVASMKTNFPPKNSIPPDYNWRRFCVGKGNISIKIVNQQRRESCEQLKNRTQDENISFFFL